MRISLGAIVVFLFICQAWEQEAAGTANVIGSWEGESKCTVPDSPCHDEHALYRITADKKNPAQLNIDGYKIGEFHVSGDSMTGRLALGADRTLYRRITVRKKLSKES